MGRSSSEIGDAIGLLCDTLSRAVGMFRGSKQRYVMLKHSESTLLYDERFINYGCNKVQYTDHLRFQGYSFYLPSDGFATDVVHQELG